MSELFKELLVLDKALNDAFVAWQAESSDDNYLTYDKALNDFEEYLYDHRDEFTEVEDEIIEYSYSNSCTVAEAIGAFENDEF